MATDVTSNDGAKAVPPEQVVRFVPGEVSVAMAIIEQFMRLKQYVLMQQARDEDMGDTWKGSGAATLSRMETQLYNTAMMLIDAWLADCLIDEDCNCPNCRATREYDEQDEPDDGDDEE